METGPASDENGVDAIVENWIDLKCHPSIHPGAVRAIAVLVGWASRTEIRMTFRLEGEIPRVWVPAPAAPRIAADLWRHTCFETFIAAQGQPAYYEFNFAPSGEWAVYAFSSYREGSLLADQAMRPRIAVRSTATRLELDAVVRLDTLSAVDARAPLRVGLSAVIEAGDGLSYWALRHPAARPDFHHDDSFALQLEPPGHEC